jgi:hypothetical protein
MIETIVGIIAGLIITVVISRYYYRLSVRHRLSVYVLQAFQVMSDVDADIRKNLKAEFYGSPVENLTILELLFVNEGTHSIRDYVEPLSVQLPAGVKLLDVTVPYVNPNERRVTVRVNPDADFEYNFSILNPREYFLTKIISDGFIDLDELTITIAADNLPARIKPQISDRVETSRHTLAALVFNLAGLAVTAFAALFFVSLLSIVERANKGILPQSLAFPLLYPASMVAVIAVLFIVSNGVLCIGFILSIVFGGRFPPPRRFPLPESVRGRDQPIKAGLGFWLGKDEE